MISRRRGSAIALKTSVVVAALAMQFVYNHIGMYVKRPLWSPGSFNRGRRHMLRALHEQGLVGNRAAYDAGKRPDLLSS